MTKLYPWLALICAAALARLMTYWLLPSHQLIGYVVTVVLAIEAKNLVQRRLSNLRQSGARN